jgi:hypothetical protein
MIFGKLWRDDRGRAITLAGVLVTAGAAYAREMRAAARILSFMLQF